MEYATTVTVTDITSKFYTLVHIPPVHISPVHNHMHKSFQSFPPDYLRDYYCYTVHMNRGFKRVKFDHDYDLSPSLLRDYRYYNDEYCNRHYILHKKLGTDIELLDLKEIISAVEGSNMYCATDYHDHSYTVLQTAHNVVKYVQMYRMYLCNALDDILMVLELQNLILSYIGLNKTMDGTIDYQPVSMPRRPVDADTYRFSEPVIPMCEFSDLKRKPRISATSEAKTGASSQFPVYLVDNMARLSMSHDKLRIDDSKRLASGSLSLVDSKEMKRLIPQRRDAINRSWMCQYCTYHVSDMTVGICPMCMHHRAVSWACGRCTLINYDCTDCKACEWKHPDLQSEKRKVMRDYRTGNWMCPFCNVENLVDSRSCKGCSKNDTYLVF